MITAAYVRTMTTYNAEMNRRVYAAAARLPDEERRHDRGAFWGSIHGTLSHLLWADRMWMSRFDGWKAPDANLGGSAAAYPNFEPMARLRCEDDTRLSAWADALPDSWLLEKQTWFSGAAGREMTAPRALLVAHLFNHQAHHRGQVHAMLTAAGETTGATDLPLILAG